MLSSRLPQNPKCNCGGSLERQFQAPSTHVKETLDNGIMGKAVERFSNAEELYKERSGKNHSD